MDYQTIKTLIMKLNPKLRLKLVSNNLITLQTDVIASQAAQEAHYDTITTKVIPR